MISLTPTFSDGAPRGARPQRARVADYFVLNERGNVSNQRLNLVASEEEAQRLQHVPTADGGAAADNAHMMGKNVNEFDKRDGGGRQGPFVPQQLQRRVLNGGAGAGLQLKGATVAVNMSHDWGRGERRAVPPALPFRDGDVVIDKQHVLLQHRSGGANRVHISFL